MLMVEHHIEVVTGLAAADRGDAPRPAARLRHARERDGATRPSRGATSGERAVSRSEPALEVRDLHVDLGGSARAPGRVLRRARGRRHGAARPQRRRQDDDAARHVGLVRRQGAVQLEGEAIDSEPTHRIVRRGVGYVPEDRDVFAGLTVDENLRLAERDGDPRYDLVYDLFPELEERGAPACRDALGRAAADARDRAGAAERRTGCCWSTSRRRDSRPVLVTEVARGARARRRAETTVLLVEQNLAVVRRARRRRGRARPGACRAHGRRLRLLDDRELVHRLLGVSGHVAVSTFLLLTITGLGLGAMYFLSPPGCR